MFLKKLILITIMWCFCFQAKSTEGEHQRPLLKGENVIYKLNIAEVISIEANHTYRIQIRNQATYLDVRRDQLAIMHGCIDGICVKDKMFDVNYSKYAVIEGIQFDGKLVAQSLEGWSGLYYPKIVHLTKTSGCRQFLNNKICIGNRVKDLSGSILVVIAFHASGELVLQSYDGWNSYNAYVDHESVILLE